MRSDTLHPPPPPNPYGYAAPFPGQAGNPACSASALADYFSPGSFRTAIYSSPRTTRHYSGRATVQRGFSLLATSLLNFSFAIPFMCFLLPRHLTNILTKVSFLALCGPGPTSKLGYIPSGVTREFLQIGIVLTMPLVGEFHRESHMSPALEFRRCSILTSLRPCCGLFKAPLVNKGRTPLKVCSKVSHFRDGATQFKRPAGGGQSKVGGVRRLLYWLEYSPPTSANGFRFPAGSLPDFRMWDSCRTMPLLGRFSRGSPVSPALSFRRAAPYSPRFTIIGSQDLNFKSRQRTRERHVELRAVLPAAQHRALTKWWRCLNALPPPLGRQFPSPPPYKHRTHTLTHTPLAINYHTPVFGNAPTVHSRMPSRLAPAAARETRHDDVYIKPTLPSPRFKALVPTGSGRSRHTTGRTIRITDMHVVSWCLHCPPPGDTRLLL
ncbi:hypothetical protein PR048_013634 [Dryococelus australis]|uniref:Uncharacterized protein n=1 Tax=Dryococelus australis TaxID=614101 RepID=A0ABQ9HSR2_9NEOP|nr:hypothetical protein PR048_013634 [Dryococelus australis]